jgi:hypothetical protein
MRMLYSSTRLENVEQVQNLFIEAGIETKVIGGRSYKNYSRREFSYNENKVTTAEQLPQLWVLHADDYRKAREILSEQGLLASQQNLSFLPDRLNVNSTKSKPVNKLNKTRMLLLAITMGLIIIQAIRLLSHNS